jgi:HEAT repeats
MHPAWAGREPDAGGADPAAWFCQPAGTDYDRWFAGFTSTEPSTRLEAAYRTVAAAGDRRTVPALLDRLERDPDPVVRKMIASRMLPRFGRDPQVRPALQRAATDDEHPGVRWAGRYALRLIENPRLEASIASATARN